MPKDARKNKSGEHNGQSISPNQDKQVNPPKKSRTDKTNLTNMDRSMEGPPDIADTSPIENIQSTIEIDSVDTQNAYNRPPRWEFIKNQTSNRYSPSNLPPYIVHIEANPSVGNLGNLHPMKLGKILAEKVSFVSDIRRLGKNIISINFSRT